MALCHYCKETATERCGICNLPVCDQHKHPVNRWHNVYHARVICEGCYQARERKRKYVLIPVVFIFAILIAKSMNVKWGLTESTTWGYFFALASVLLGITGAAAIFNAITRTCKVKVWVKRLFVVVVLWCFLYFVYYNALG